MPLAKNITTIKGGKLLLWKVTESISELLNLVNITPKEQETFTNFKSESRKKEFLTTRLLVQQYLGVNTIINYTQHGKPFLENSIYNISITHTKNYVAILTSLKHRVALDMEILSDKVERIAHKFLSAEELKNIDSENRILHLYQHWCAKECLIKFYGKKDIHLTNELIIKPFTPDNYTFTGKVLRSDFNQEYSFYQILFDNYLIVYGLD